MADTPDLGLALRPFQLISRCFNIFHNALAGSHLWLPTFLGLIIKELSKWMKVAQKVAQHRFEPEMHFKRIYILKRVEIPDCNRRIK